MGTALSILIPYFLPPLLSLSLSLFLTRTHKTKISITGPMDTCGHFLSPGCSVV